MASVKCYIALSWFYSNIVKYLHESHWIAFVCKPSWSIWYRNPECIFSELTLLYTKARLRWPPYSCLMSLHISFLTLVGVVTFANFSTSTSANAWLFQSLWEPVFEVCFLICPIQNTLGHDQLNFDEQWHDRPFWSIIHLYSTGITIRISLLVAQNYLDQPIKASGKKKQNRKQTRGAYRQWVTPLTFPPLNHVAL